MSALKNGSGSFQTGGEWQAIDRSSSGPLEEIETVNRCCLDFYQHIFWSGDGISHFLKLQNVRFAIVRKLYSFQKIAPSYISGVVDATGYCFIVFHHWSIAKTIVP